MIQNLARNAPRARQLAILALAAVSTGWFAVGCSSLSDSSGTESEQPVALPLNWDDRGGKYPDTNYAIRVEPHWHADNLEIWTGVASDAYEHLEALECGGVAAELSTGSDDAPSPVISIDLGRVESVNVDCEATFDGRRMLFGIEWPDVYRNGSGKVDLERSNLSICHVGGDDGPVPTKADLDPESSLIECDRSTLIARSSPSDYWLSPGLLIIYP